MSSLVPAVVIGLDCITGLQTARLIARHGIPVVGIARDRGHFCTRTRVCREIVQADTSRDTIVDVLETIAERLGTRPVLYPCTDSSVLHISRARRRLDDRCHVALPRHQAVETLTSKPAFARHARTHGFRVPATVEVGSREDLDAACSTLRFPCILKPAIKDARWLSRTRQKAFKAIDPADLAVTFETCASWSGQFIVQEWIEGPESDLYSCNVYFAKDGAPWGTFVARKIRQWPPETGTSALGVECRNDRVRNEAVRLFRSVGYHGLGYVEMKLDGRTNDLVLIEANVGRPTGRSAIAEAGGVELLYAMYCDLTGSRRPGELRQTYRDAKWIYLRHDLQAAFHAWSHGRLSAAAWWRSVRGPKVYAVLSATDPAPFVFDCWHAVRSATRRRRPHGAVCEPPGERAVARRLGEN